MGMWNQTLTPFHDITGHAKAWVQSNFSATNFAGDIVDRVNEHAKKLTDISKYRKTLAANRKVLNNDIDGIVDLYELGQFQNANSKLQGYLVAMPEYRNMYNNDMAAGFENGFSQFDKFRGTAYMHTDANYREATSGLVNKYDDKIYTWMLSEERLESLNDFERMAIMRNWERMHNLDWEDSDPCSEFNASCPY